MKACSEVDHEAVEDLGVDLLKPGFPGRQQAPADANQAQLVRQLHQERSATRHVSSHGKMHDKSLPRARNAGEKHTCGLRRAMDIILPRLEST